MSTGLATTSPVRIDAASLAEQLKDKIRLDLAELMPEEVWQKLVQEQIHSFLTEEPPSNHWEERNKKNPPLLRKIVHDVLGQIAREKVKEMLATPEWEGFWDGERKMAGVHIETLIKENASEILFGLLQQSFQGVVSQMKEQM